MSISNFMENKLGDHISNGAAAVYTPPSTLYAGLSRGDPLDDASGLDEPTGIGSYAREVIAFDAAAGRQIVQSAEISFTEATASWGEITHYAIFDALNGGNMMASGARQTPSTVYSGNTAILADGEITITFLSSGNKTVSTNNISDYLAEILLDFAFRDQSFPQPDTYLANIITTAVTDAMTGSTITEPGGGNYSRLRAYPNGDGSSPNWNLASAGVVDNEDDFTFPTPSAPWGATVGWAVVTASSGGQVLFYDNNPIGVGQTPDTGDTVIMVAGASNWSLT